MWTKTADEVLDRVMEFGKRTLSACCREAAALDVLAATTSGDLVRLHMILEVGVLETITATPLPNTIDLKNPPPGFDMTLHFSSPPSCLGDECTLRDLLWLELPTHSFEGFVTFAGQTYDSRLKLTFCISAVNSPGANQQIQRARIYAPEVSIWTWELPY